MHALVAAVILRDAGRVRSGTMPGLIQRIDNRLSPPGARLANGAPLSVRITRGNLYSRKAASNTAAAVSLAVRPGVKHPFHAESAGPGHRARRL